MKSHSFMYPSIYHNLAQNKTFKDIYDRRELGEKKCGPMYITEMYLKSEKWWEGQFRQHKLTSDLNSDPDL